MTGVSIGTSIGTSPPDRGDDWVALERDVLPIDAVNRWVIVPGCGAMVTFVGTVRDHSEDRSGVSALAYEAYDEHVGPRLHAVAAAARGTWPEIGRIALLHRVGVLDVTEPAVVVAVSTPHRLEAFEAASYCIDALKSTVPIWKQEFWAGGRKWASDQATL